MRRHRTSSSKRRSGPTWRVLRSLALVLIALLVMVAGAISTTVRFTLRTANDVVSSTVVRLYREALPTMLERSQELDLESSAVEVWRGAEASPATPPFPFAPDRPTLIVLLHGATRTPDDGSGVGTLAGARDYWGYHFVAGLVGAEGLQTLDGIPLTPDGWSSAAVDDDAAADHIVVASNAAGPGGRYVALLHRDGSEHLGPQTEATVAQLGELSDHLAERLGVTPQIVLLSHSMGGLVARYLLTVPAATTPPFVLSRGGRERAASLRDRTLYLVTMSTPHEGSRAADDALLMERVTTLTDATLEQFSLERDRDPQRAAMAFLRAFQPSTQHLRTDTLAGLNDPETGLLAPQRARRGDGSLVPIYALSGRSPGGGFLNDPRSSLALELSLLDLQGGRLGLGAKLRNDTLSMLLSDYLVYNFPGLEHGWGATPTGLEVLDRVARSPLIGSFEVSVASGERSAVLSLSLEAFPVAYLERAWPALDGADPSPNARFERWLQSLTTALLERPDLTTLPVELVERASVDDLRCRLLGEATCAPPPIGAASDGLVDADGVVAIDSGLGLYLGTDTPYFFGHDRRWDLGSGPERGSWYRIVGEGYPREGDAYPWEWGNHAFVQYSPEVARWLERNLLAAAGPFVGSEPVSGWRPEP